MTQLGLYVVERKKKALEELCCMGPLRHREPALSCQLQPKQEAIRPSECKPHCLEPIQYGTQRLGKRNTSPRLPAQYHSQQLHGRKHSKRKATNHDQQIPRQLQGSSAEGAWQAGCLQLGHAETPASGRDITKGIVKDWLSLESSSPSAEPGAPPSCPPHHPSSTYSASSSRLR